MDDMQQGASPQTSASSPSMVMPALIQPTEAHDLSPELAAIAEAGMTAAQVVDAVRGNNSNAAPTDDLALQVESLHARVQTVERLLYGPQGLAPLVSAMVPQAAPVVAALPAVGAAVEEGFSLLGAVLKLWHHFGSNIRPG